MTVYTPASLAREIGEDEPVRLSDGKKGFVYFIKIKGFVKIGFAQNVAARLSHIQCATPFTAKLLHVEPTAGSLEGVLHDRFRVYHHRGEWFVLSQEIKDHIAFLKKRREP